MELVSGSLSILTKHYGQDLPWRASPRPKKNP